MARPLASLFGHVLKKYHNQPDESLPLPECVMGIEIEVEGGIHGDRLISHEGRNSMAFVNPDFSAYWNIVADGSLRDGVELVTPQLYGKDLVKAISTLSDINQSLRVTPVFSYRCSTHVHMDVRDMDKSKFLNLAFVYLMYEKYLFKYWSKRRESNIYCIPLNNCYSHISPMMQLVKEDNDEILADIMRQFSEPNRYCAFNIAALQKYGSIEFRHGEGTFDSEKIFNWVRILMHLKRYAMHVSTDELLSSITERPFVDLSHEVFGDMYNILLGDVDVTRLKNELFKTKRRIKSLLSCTHQEGTEFEIPPNIKEINDQTKAFLNKHPQGQHFSDYLALRIDLHHGKQPNRIYRDSEEDEEYTENEDFIPEDAVGVYIEGDLADIPPAPRSLLQPVGQQQLGTALPIFSTDELTSVMSNIGRNGR